MQCDIGQFARDYTAAWCSQEPLQVAAFFAEEATLQINDAEPAVGRPAIAALVQRFMTAFPDLQVKLDKVVPVGDVVEFHWTLSGTNTGPGGTGAPVCFSGFEEWVFDDNGLIVRSKGHYDDAEYQRQLAGVTTS